MNPLRDKIIKVAESQLGKPYIFGHEVDLDNANPDSFDCSEFVEWVFRQVGLHMPDGSFNQFPYTVAVDSPEPADLGFFGNEKGIYHVGIVYDALKVIEARGFPYNKVIFRPLIAWTHFNHFKGWRSHPQLLNEA